MSDFTWETSIDPEWYSDKQEWAAMAARLGFALIPLHRVDTEPAYDGTPGARCVCSNIDCTAIGKHPALMGWNKTTAVTEMQARLLVMADRRRGFGVVTGSASRVVVLDDDPRNGGAASLERLQARRGALPATLTVVTGRGDGGRHRYYGIAEGVYVPTVTNGLGDGLDVKGEKGFVCWPPSQHKSGGYYDLDRTQPMSITPLPEDLLAELARPATPQVPEWAVLAMNRTNPVRFAERTLNIECDKLAAARNPGRNTALNKAAFALGQLIALDLLHPAEVIDALVRAAVRSGLDRGEIPGTVRSGIVSGAALVDVRKSVVLQQYLRRIEGER